MAGAKIAGNSSTKAGAGAPRYRLLCAVWGQTYIERFARLSLASLLAQGNLEALGGPEQVEIVFLTSEKDVEGFETLDLMKGVQKHASIRFLAIDDLIVPGQYSVTLTLAFFRGIKSYGDEATRLHFIFWNADFILAAGSFQHVHALASSGRRLIMTGTIRALSPVAERALLKRERSREGALNLQARDLVRLALDWPQHHHAAKVVNQHLAWSDVASQMFWRDGADLMIGRFYQAFMLCLAPTRVPAGINGPCDYSFMPELCPGERVHMIADSDDFFALEVGEADQERHHVYLGPKADESARRDNMKEWLTREHQETAETDVVFRAGDVSGERIEAARAELGKYHAEFMADMPGPVSHANVYYWTWGVAAWREKRDDLDPSAPLPPELADTLSLADLASVTYARRYATIAKTISPVLPPKLAWFEPLATAHALAGEAAGEIRPAAEQAIIVAQAGRHIDRHFPPGAAPPHRMEANVAAYWRLEPASLSHALVWQTEDGHQDVLNILTNISPALADQASVRIVTLLTAPLDYPAWIDEQRRKALPLAGLLDDLQMRMIAAPIGQARYDALVRRAYHGWRSDPRWVIKAWAPIKIGLAAARKLVLKKPGPPMALVVTGRLRKP